MSKEQERLQKRIANSGYTSRRKAEVLITEGRVKVNGQTVTELGSKVMPSDLVEVDGINPGRDHAGGDPVHLSMAVK